MLLALSWAQHLRKIFKIVLQHSIVMYIHAAKITIEIDDESNEIEAIHARYTRLGHYHSESLFHLSHSIQVHLIRSDGQIYTFRTILMT